MAIYGRRPRASHREPATFSCHRCSWLQDHIVHKRCWERLVIARCDQRGLGKERTSDSSVSSCWKLWLSLFSGNWSSQACYRYSYNPRDETVSTHANSLADYMLNAMSSVESSSDEQPSHAHPRCGLITHSFGGVVARAALNSLTWRRGWTPAVGRIRCVLFAPPNRGSSFAKKMMPETWEEHLEGWDSAKMALDALSKSILGEKVSEEDASMPHSVVVYMHIAVRPRRVLIRMKKYFFAFWGAWARACSFIVIVLHIMFFKFLTTLYPNCL